MSGVGLGKGGDVELTELQKVELAEAQKAASAARATVEGVRQLPAGEMLRSAKALADRAQELVDLAVAAEREKGTSWESIGEVLDGVTKSAVQKRYGRKVLAWHDRGEKSGQDHFGYLHEQLEHGWRAVTRIANARGVINDLAAATAAAATEDSADDVRRYLDVTLGERSPDVPVQAQSSYRPPATSAERGPAEPAPWPVSIFNVTRPMRLQAHVGGPGEDASGSASSDPPSLEERVASLEGKVDLLLRIAEQPEDGELREAKAIRLPDFGPEPPMSDWGDSAEAATARTPYPNGQSPQSIRTRPVYMPVRPGEAPEK
ncbi:hypothetical protein [Streptomyces albogriseolus]|uniref:hypothetical protein n=1 Tax=Streptomyces albogriseolus TaxID=1887 RepID=UPI00381B44AB